MNIEAIIATFLSAAAFLKKPVQDAAAQSVKDVFEAARYYLRKKFGAGSDGAQVLDLATEKPESIMRKAMLVEEATLVGMETDSEIVRLAQELAELLPETDDTVRQDVRVSGRGNHVQVAGRDLVVHAAKHIRRNIITPDGRHLTPQQRENLRTVVAEVAERMAVGDAGPNFAAVHRLLQRRFNVASYALIPRERGDEALSFLKQQRAIFRSRLRRRNPLGYDRNFYRAIFSLAGELGWERSKVYRLAAEKLGLKTPLTSLRQLGSNQLESLTKCLRSEVRKARAGEPVHALG